MPAVAARVQAWMAQAQTSDASRFATEAEWGRYLEAMEKERAAVPVKAITVKPEDWAQKVATQVRGDTRCLWTPFGPPPDPLD
eukprot:1525297-Pyramimonas_sp.AAC.1